MTTIHNEPATPPVQADDNAFDDAQLAAASYLARYSGRTLEAYRHDLRCFFQWAADAGLAVLEATRPHIELYRAGLEQRGLAASTIDRRLSTVCGFFRFAHIDRGLRPTRRSTSAGRRCTPSTAPASTGPSLAASSSPPSGSTPTTPPSPCCSS